ncbi:MAG: hypothetical protein U0V70_10565 [Terriglobia bacterium]
MSSFSISIIVFASVFGGALLGILLRRVLPDHHLGQDSKDVVKVAMGLVATMAALVLGLLTATAKGTFDTESDELKKTAATIITLDRYLAAYGPETKEIREEIRRALAARLDLTWPEDRSRRATLDTTEASTTLEAIVNKIYALSPQNEAQRRLQSKSLEVANDVLGTRWLLLTQAGNTIPFPLLVMTVFWLSVLFVSFGLFAPSNATVIAALLLCAISVSGSTFLILEMNRPLQGMVKVSSEPLRFAYSQLGK